MLKQTTLTIVCAWCNKDMGEKDGQGVSGTTHGICPDCQEKIMNELKERRIENHDTSNKMQGIPAREKRPKAHI